MKRKWLRSRAIRRIKPLFGFMLLIILLVLTFSYAMFQGGFVSWFLFFSFLPFAFYAVALFFYPLQDFKVTRVNNSKEVNAGERLFVEIQIKRSIPFPLLFLIVEDVVPNVLYRQQSKQMLFPGFKREITISYAIERTPRGEHILEAVCLKTGDALGFVQKERYFDCRDTILVYPQTEEIVYRPFESRFEQGGTASAMQFQKDTSLVAGVRQYQPGDRFAWIDWKATARTNDMMSKEFEIRQSNDVLIVLDRTPASAFEELVKFSASAAKAILRNGGQVGVFSSGEERTFIPIRGGEWQQQQLFQHLAKVKHDSDIHLAKLLAEEPALYQQPASVLVITSFLDKEFIESAGSFMKRQGAIYIYLIKGNEEAPTKEEQMLKAEAYQRGLVILTIDEKDFRTAFSEVRLA